MKFIRILLVLSVLLSLQYYKTTIYDFTKSQKFSGPMFYNPYENINKSWIKANFHAHNKLHYGLANGENSPEEIYTLYDSLKYNFAGISNYNYILPNHYNRSIYLPIYEHGRNFGTIHQLSLNSKSVKKFDFLLAQNIHHKQQVINKQQENSELVILAHPSFKNGYIKKELQLLNNYNLFEILSPRASSISLWDEALSTGHAVWGTGSDDAHNLKEGSAGVCWTMVNTTDSSDQGILEALKAGRFYATRGWMAQEMHRLKSVEVNNMVYTMQLNRNADSIILKSDFGKTVAYITNADEIKYQIKPDNTYIRAEIFESEEWNTYTKTYLNPVIRVKKQPLQTHNNEAVPNIAKTWLFRIILFAIHFTMLFIAIRRLKFLKFLLNKS